jgi:hypothetical protein
MPSVQQHPSFTNAIIALGVGHFQKNNPLQDSAKYYTTLNVISIVSMILVLIICAILLEAQPLASLPLFQVSCAFASQFHHFDHKTICQSHVLHNPSFTNVDLGVQLLHRRHRPQHRPSILNMVPPLAKTHNKIPSTL